ncbi:pleckstrin homology domain-containing family F member 1 homolog [Drosophila innubila]|uniref:pleckstrin homology domain-containing family F member 1 homolog n=1 Tax=Drosophila innubila TaxID=198719 RepID=UPI00148E4BEB|nr:pleckstrin homology domain-containing family F member 1 homolog [Drosophila innubila]
MVDRLVNSELNTRRIANVESCFGSSGVPLAIPGRVLVGEGVLTKMCRKRPKSRQFFLFNDILVYGNIVIGKKKYNKQHIMPLEEVSLESINDNQQYHNGWYIRTTTKSFVVYAATSTEKQEWMAHINKCVEDLLRKSGKKPVENHAAVWVPDAEASICMHCKKTQFTFVQRRHHCRNCGAVVCAACSTKKYMLPQQSTKAQRVCDACYERLRVATLSDVDADVEADADASLRSGNNKLNADSSNDDDTDEDAADAQHDQPRFYGDNSMISTLEDSNAATVTGTGNSLPVQTTPANAMASASNNC